MVTMYFEDIIFFPVLEAIYFSILVIHSHQEEMEKDRGIKLRVEGVLFKKKYTIYFILFKFSGFILIALS